MTEAAFRVALIYGSAREGRSADAIGAWLQTQIEHDGRIQLDVIDPLALNLSVRHTSDSVDALRLRSTLGQADGFIVLTPEYNHSFPAALKAIIDAAKTEWEVKPVGFVSYGGISGGIRAVEQLRQVFAELHAVSLRDGVSLANAWTFMAQDGSFRPPPEAEAALHFMLGKLAWWAMALHDARLTMPYDAVA